jgi:hypothetical protein
VISAIAEEARLLGKSNEASKIATGKQSVTKGLTRRKLNPKCGRRREGLVASGRMIPRRIQPLQSIRPFRNPGVNLPLARRAPSSRGFPGFCLAAMSPVTVDFAMSSPV